MISCDTNILFYAYNKSSPLQEKAMRFLVHHSQNIDFIICELVLIELYVLLRNPAVVKKPLSSQRAVAVCRKYRQNSNWRVIDYPGNLMNRIWDRVSKPQYPRRSIFDARLAFTLLHHGVTDFATRNKKHFADYGFKKVWNPLE